MTEKITVQVTEEDIKGGLRESCHACPIALALKRLGYERPTVDGVAIDLDTLTTIPSPDVVNDFVIAFDKGDKVKPFAFDLEIPRG